MYFRNFSTLIVKYSYLYFCSHGVYGSKVKKGNKHQYVNECHFISHHWSNTEEHDENLQNTFEVIKESGLKLNKEKCEIKKNKLTYFGHVLSAEGVSPDPEKVKIQVRYNLDLGTSPANCIYQGQRSDFK